MYFLKSIERDWKASNVNHFVIRAQAVASFPQLRESKQRKEVLPLLALVIHYFVWGCWGRNEGLRFPWTASAPATGPRNIRDQPNAH